MKIGADPMKGRICNGYQKGFQEGDDDLQVQELLLVRTENIILQEGGLETPSFFIS